VTTSADTTRADNRLGVGALAFFVTVTTVLGLLGVVIAVPVLVRGVSTAKVSAIALAFALSATASIVIARRADLAQDPQRLQTPIAIGIAAGALVIAVAAVANTIRSSNGFGWADGLAIGLCVGVALVTHPLARWLSHGNRVSTGVDAVVDRRDEVGPHHDGRPTSSDAVIVTVGLIVLAIGLVVILPNGPFGHDESIYALKAREWISGTPSTGWAVYRPVGMSVLGWFVLQFSSSEVAFRFVAAGISLATIATMWVAGRVMYDRATATVGAAVFLSTGSFLRRATEFLNDVSSAGLLLAAMVVIWYHFERKPSGWWLVAVAPFGAAAYYMRYGSALALSIIALISIVIWHRELIASWKQITVTAAVLIGLLVPHFVWAIDLTGSPLGIFESASTSVGGGGGGLSDYLRWLPSHLAGPIGAALMGMAVLYLVAVLVYARRDSARYGSEARTVAFSMATAVVVTIALGTFTHGEPRFVYLPLMLALLTGARAATLVWSELRSRPRLIITVIAAAVFAVGFTAGVGHMSRALKGITDSRDVLVGASDVVRTDAGSSPCEIRSSYVPQLTWYAVCSTYLFSRPIPESDPAYLVLFENGKRQPVGADLESEISATDGEPPVFIDDEYDKIGDGLVFTYP
jgi:4-amino-4-deoxy-L-arabinose transferase-like glycosyltransferase